MPSDNKLHKAAHEGDMETCKMLIEGSVEEEVPFTVNDIGASDRRPLHRSAGAGHLLICQYFLELGADVNAVWINKTLYSYSIFLSYMFFCCFFGCHRKIKVGEQLCIGQQSVVTQKL
jgi:ankyrin repeat protein